MGGVGGSWEEIGRKALKRFRGRGGKLTGRGGQGPGQVRDEGGREGAI